MVVEIKINGKSWFIVIDDDYTGIGETLAEASRPDRMVSDFGTIEGRVSHAVWLIMSRNDL